MRLFKGNESSRPLPILVDSGADHTFFRSEVADLIGVDWKAGTKMAVQGIGRVDYWLVEDLGVALRSGSDKVALKLNVGFMPDLAIHGLVGRQFFFETFDVLISETEKLVTLELRQESPYLIEWKDVPIYKPKIPKAKRGYQQKKKRRK